MQYLVIDCCNNSKGEIVYWSHACINLSAFLLARNSKQDSKMSQGRRHVTTVLQWNEKIDALRLRNVNMILCNVNIYYFILILIFKNRILIWHEH